MKPFITIDQFIHIHLPDGRTFQMEKWQARQVARELMVHFGIFSAFAPDIDNPGKIVDIYEKDDWLKKYGKKETFETCPKLSSESANISLLNYSDPKSEKS